MKRSLSRMLCFLLISVFVLNYAISESQEIAFDVDNYSWDELISIKDTVNEKIAEYERLYAVENGNRSIVFDQEKYSLCKGKQIKLSPEIKRNTPDAPGKTKLLWGSSNDSIAKVNPSGVVNGIDSGDVVITASAVDDANISASVLIHIVQPVDNLIIDKKSINLLLGADDSLGQTTLSVEVAPQNAYDKSVSWFSSDEQIAKVDQNGKVSAVNIGKATITAISNDELSSQKKKAICNVTVTRAIESIKLDRLQVNMKSGDKIKLSATVNPEDSDQKKIDWLSSNEMVATVDRGTVIAKSNGECEITAVSTDGSNASASCKIDVIEMVSKIEIVGQSAGIDLEQGGSKVLAAKVSPSTATNKEVRWRSSDRKVATVSPDGKVTAVGPGSCQITCVAKDGSKKKASINVRVESKVIAQIDYVSWENRNYGVIRVYLGYKNTSINKTIDSVEVQVRLYDTYDSLIDSGQVLLDKKVVTPGKRYSSGGTYWIFSGDANVRKAKISISRIHTVDGKVYSYTYDETGSTWQ